MLLLVTIGILFTLYGALLLWYARSWDRLSIFQPGVAASVRISVVIAARNEERSIGALLDSLQQQSYPQQYTEIIVVDDHSEDQTAAIVKRYPAVRLVEAPPGGVAPSAESLQSLIESAKVPACSRIGAIWPVFSAYLKAV